MQKLSKIQQYVSNASPLEWWEYAQELRNSSEELWMLSNNTMIATYESETQVATKVPGVSRTYMLIIGVCLENLLKGMSISENPNLVKDGRIDNSISSGHNIYELSTKLKTVKFSHEEKGLFKILSDAIPYWGKYPIPKRFEQMKQQTLVTPFIREIFLGLYTKLERAIYDTTKFGWDGPNEVHIGEWLVSNLEDFPPGHEKMSFEELYDFRRKKEKGQ